MEEVLNVATSHEEARAFYNRLSRFYDLLTERSEGPLRERGLALLEVRPGEKVLEIGVGTGRGALALARAVGSTGKVYGVDIAERMIAVSRARLRREGLESRAELERADALALPQAEGSLDAVFLSFTLELFDTPELPKVLGECRRVLRPDGRIVVVGLSKEHGSPWPLRLYEWGHRRFPRLLDCRPIYVARALGEAGFEIEKSDLAKVSGIPVEIVRARKPGGAGVSRQSRGYSRITR